MSLPGVAEFLEDLEQYELLDHAQLQKVNDKLEGHNPDVRTLAKALVQRGWLTAFQANHLCQGRGRELVLGTYILLDKLGEGGMGQVLKARHKKLDRVVALKLIRKERLASADALKRFNREMQATAKLCHPNVVQAYDAGEVDGTHYLAVEFVDGIDLAQLVKERGPLPVGQACDYIRQSALGLQHAHEHGMVHRDIKPHNLLLASKGSLVKILDMGLARLNKARGDGSGTMTQENTIMGTPDYMAPEQSLDAHAIDIRADLYSLGCTLWYLLTGRVPFPCETLTQKLVAHQLQEPAPLVKWRPDVPPDVAAIVRKLMAKKPADRYATPAELATALLPHCQRSPENEARTIMPRSGSAAADAPSAEIASTLQPGPVGLIRAGTRPMGQKRRLFAIGGAAAALLLLVGTIAVLVAVSSRSRHKESGSTGLPHLEDAANNKELDTPHQRFTNSIGMSFVLIPAGKFLMGSPDTELDRKDDETQHEVAITTAFFMGVYEVTQEEYERVMETNPSYFSNTGKGTSRGVGQDTKLLPVESVSWDDAVSFCKKLSTLPEERLRGRMYRLPTEAEWEYACRAGTTTAFHDGNVLLSTEATFTPAGTPPMLKTTRVGSYPPNAFGLHDMHGNVWEWCADYYGPHYYSNSDSKDPKGPYTGTSRVVRGGGWNNDNISCRSAYRGGNSPSVRSSTCGFRAVCVR